MSLLGSQVYANPDTPLWVRNTGDIINGNLEVTGQVIADGGLVTYDAPAGGLTILNAAGTVQETRILHNPAPTARTIIQSSDPIFFNQIGTANGNTSLTISAFGANTDALSVGGTVSAVNVSGTTVTSTGLFVGPGVTPNVSGPTGILSIPVGASLTGVVVPPPQPIVAGETYDIQVAGYWGIPGGSSPALDDKATILVAVGTGTAPGYFEVSAEDLQYPGLTSDVWAASSLHPFKIRCRLRADGTLPVVTCYASFTGSGIYPLGQVEYEFTSVSIVRVA